jgi:hypothetical protein
LKDGPFKPCVVCGMGKAKQRNIPKSVESSNPVVGECIHADISTIRKKVDSKQYVRLHWFMMVDAASGIKFSSFWKAKNDFVETACQVLHHRIGCGNSDQEDPVRQCWREQAVGSKVQVVRLEIASQV